MNIDLATQPPLGCPRRVGQVVVVSVPHYQYVDVVWRRSGLTGVACSPRTKDVRLTDPLDPRQEVGENRDRTVGQRQQFGKRPGKEMTEVRSQQPKISSSLLHDEASSRQLVGLTADRRLGNAELVGQFSH
jgi:hypothetical protein